MEETRTASPAQTSESLFQAADVTAIASAHAMHDTFPSFLPSLVPLLIDKFSLSNTQVGFFTACLRLPSVLQPVLGHISDRRDLRWIAMLAPAITATAMSLLGIAPGYAAILVLLLVAGISSAAFHSVAPAMAGRISGKQLGRGMSYWMVGGELGRTLGPILAVGAVSWLTLPGLPFVMVMGWAASLILYFRLRAIPVDNSHTQNGLPWREALHMMKPVLVPLVGLMIARSMLENSIAIYLPVYLTQKGASLWLAGASLTIYEAAGLVGALLGGSLSDRLGRKKVILISIIAAPLLTGAFLISPVAARLPLLLLMGFSILCVNPVVMALVQETTPQNRALSLGIFLGINFVIGSIASVTAGMLGDAFNLSIAFAGSAALYLLGAPLVLLLPRAGKP